MNLQSCYLIPTTDKLTRVRRTLPTLIDNISVNNPDRVYANRNVVSDISDYFSQFCILNSAAKRPKLRIRKCAIFPSFHEIPFSRIFRKWTGTRSLLEAVKISLISIVYSRRFILNLTIFRISMDL